MSTRGHSSQRSSLSLVVVARDHFQIVEASLLTTDLSQMDVVSVSAQLKQRSRDPKYIKILEILFISTKLFDRFYWMHDQEQDIWICAKLKLSKNITHSSS